MTGYNNYCMYTNKNIIIYYSVCHLAGVFAKSLKEKLEKDAQIIPIHETQERKQYRFEDKEVLCVQIAGLCHDLGKIYKTVTVVTACM